MVAVLQWVKRHNQQQHKKQSVAEQQQGKHQISGANNTAVTKHGAQLV
jgi:hypothetical protein